MEIRRIVSVFAVAAALPLAACEMEEEPVDQIEPVEEVQPGMEDGGLYEDDGVMDDDMMDDRGM